MRCCNSPKAQEPQATTQERRHCVIGQKSKVGLRAETWSHIMADILSRLRDRIKRLFCQHDWKVCKFQRLGSGGPSYQCTKCGGYRHAD